MFSVDTTATIGTSLMPREIGQPLGSADHVLLAPLGAKPCVFTMDRTQRMAGIIQLMTRIRCDTHESSTADTDRRLRNMSTFRWHPRIIGVGSRCAPTNRCRQSVRHPRIGVGRHRSTAAKQVYCCQCTCFAACERIPAPAMSEDAASKSAICCDMLS